MPYPNYPDALIARILRSVKTIAMVGASPNGARPSYFAMKYLLDKGFKIIPVNPGPTEILGQKCYARVSDLPAPVDMVDIFRNSEAALAITRQALALDPLPKVIWMQLSVRNDEAARLAEDRGIAVVMNRCPKMEYGKLSGEWAWVGGNPGLLSSRRQTRHASGRFQSLGIAPKR